jgi:hypothetical protein
MKINFNVLLILEDHLQTNDQYTAIRDMYIKDAHVYVLVFSLIARVLKFHSFSIHNLVDVQ